MGGWALNGTPWWQGWLVFLAGVFIFLAGVIVGLSLEASGLVRVPAFLPQPQRPTPTPTFLPVVIPTRAHTPTPSPTPLPSPTPTPSPTPVPEGLTYRVITSGANVRPCPEASQRCPPVATLVRCDTVLVDPASRGQQWLRVSLPGREEPLYMHQSVLEPGTCPESPPTPTATPVG